jgi:hypothetical protein
MMLAKGMAATRGSLAKNEPREAVGKMTEAQEEAEEWEQKEQDWKALEQRCEEVMSQVAANLVAEKEKIRDAEVVATELAQALSEMETLDAMDPVLPGIFCLDRSLTALGLVGDEEDPMSEDPSERDPKAVYSEDEAREGASQ